MSIPIHTERGAFKDFRLYRRVKLRTLPVLMPDRKLCRLPEGLVIGIGPEENYLIVLLEDGSAEMVTSPTQLEHEGKIEAVQLKLMNLVNAPDLGPYSKGYEHGAKQGATFNDFGAKLAEVHKWSAQQIMDFVAPWQGTEADVGAMIAAFHRGVYEGMQESLEPRMGTSEATPFTEHHEREAERRGKELAASDALERTAEYNVLGVASSAVLPPPET